MARISRAEPASLVRVQTATFRKRYRKSPSHRSNSPPAVAQTCTIVATVVNRLGLHARPAMTFVDLAMTFRSAVTVRKADTEVDGKSIMQMMMLAAGQGSELTITATGDDAEAACAGLKNLVESGFDEE